MESGWFAEGLAALGAVLALFGLWWFAWSVVLRWLRVLWVCRIPALSAGLGIALFSLAAAILITLGSITIPLGRRRGWRSGPMENGS